MFQKALSLFSKTSKNTYATEASFETKPYKLHKLEAGPSTNVSITQDEAIKLYTQMNTIRRLETASGSLYKEKIVRGFCHLYSGQVNLWVKQYNFVLFYSFILIAFHSLGSMLCWN